MANEKGKTKLRAGDERILKLMETALYAMAEEDEKKKKLPGKKEKKKRLWYNLIIWATILGALWWVIDSYNKIHGVG